GGGERAAYTRAGQRLGPALDEVELAQELLRLRRHDVEGVGDEQLRLLQAAEVLRHQVRQAGRVDFARGVALVFLRPRRKGGRVFRRAAGADAPLVDEPPRLAALLRGGLFQQEVLAGRGTADDFFPDVLLLRRRQQQRQLLAQVAVERVFPQALDERAEGQDIRRLPHG